MTIQAAIENRLQALEPRFLEVENESNKHNVPEGSESHFKVTVVSDQFSGKMLLARHRLVNDLLADELSGPVHALALHTLTPDEWFEKFGSIPHSPPCLGGSAGDKL
jgi:BolA protein